MVKLFFLIVGIFLVVWFVFGPQIFLSLWRTITPTPAPNQISLFNWQRYDDPNLKISINHPNHWLLSTSPTELIISSTQESLGGETRKEQIQITIDQIPQPEGQTLQDYAYKTQPQGFKIKSQEKVRVDNVEGVKITQEVTNPGLAPSEIIYLPRQSRLYVITATPADSELKPFFDQVLESFKFL